MPIRILPPILANRIAAGGDAVERLLSGVEVPVSTQINDQE